ncbi:Transcription-repair coupling factor [hydrothermal vent metagenome]|uniref:Transcription-repair coupling factor n=1 Tax=hydrothermal vent metagenome TaxID=652676 RepID=A0A3B1BLU6_9ZZZZ
MSDPELLSPLTPPAPLTAGHVSRWGQLYGSSFALLIAQMAQQHAGPLVIITADAASAQRLEYAIRFFLGKNPVPMLSFPDRETLPWDHFSPHQDITSERLASLYQLPDLDKGILIVPTPTLMHRLPPRHYLDGHALLLETGQKLDLEGMRLRLEASGYNCVSTVMEHGEFAVRGSLLDLYPMGSREAYRIELFDDEIESIRMFDPETQRSADKVNQIRLLPARECPLNKDGISHFRQAFRAKFTGNAHNCPLYRDISNGMATPGIEYYLPLFFEQTATLFDYLPDNTLLLNLENIEAAAETFWDEIGERHEQMRHDTERPLLSAAEVFLPVNEVFAAFKRYPRIELQQFKLLPETPASGSLQFATSAPPELHLDVRADQPASALKNFLAEFKGRVLFAAETSGRREYLLELLHSYDLYPASVDGWSDFLAADNPLAITVAPLEQGLLLSNPALMVIAEPQLFGARVMQRRRRKKSSRDIDSIIRNLAELTVGAPVVHEEHGVGRYLGLQTLDIANQTTEFLSLEYAANDKLYVPVSSLHLISRYTGADPEHAPLHRLGSGQWERAKRRANERVRDVAAELLDIYARREARSGFSYPLDETQYRAFSASFPFEETPDQQTSIDKVLENMRSDKPMDHLVCGDVGFGKTEVAMRAAFVAVQAGRQVAVLVPTTLLTRQHMENFRDRFADWPVRIESLSRFNSAKEQKQILTDLETGQIDIIIGTHKLLQKDLKYKNLGLVIIDEEHRFGVRQKETFKAMRAEVDILTLTATPIPRTLNMAMSGLRDLSIIATPPARRLAIKTFVSEWKPAQIKEACLRELKRGGQVYFLHNDVQTIEKQVSTLQQLLPEADIRHAHGQMRERELEQVMSDFYHQRFNILVCTTIIETGIDIPSANTIIMNRADRFGLAQLYQLRGRVGRSHHRAYAYLIIPPRKSISADARKRLEAIESIETLGTGFTLASHDMEIRGAGELLGDEQSGQMIEIGFSLYSELLERAVKALKEGKEPELDKPLFHGAEIDLHTPALIPEDYLPDIHERLIMYKRIASAADKDTLRELQVEMIDRFGLLPEAAKTLFSVTELKLRATQTGIKKIDLADGGGRILFVEQPDIDPMTIIKLIQGQPDRYKLDGSDKLRIIRELPDTEARLNAANHLLDRLQTTA